MQAKVVWEIAKVQGGQTGYQRYTSDGVLWLRRANRTRYERAYMLAADQAQQYHALALAQGWQPADTLPIVGSLAIRTVSGRISRGAK